MRNYKVFLYVLTVVLIRVLALAPANGYELNLAKTGGDTPPPPTCLAMNNLPYPADTDYYSGPASVQMTLNTYPDTTKRICVDQASIHGIITTYNSESGLGWYSDPNGIEAALEEKIQYFTDGYWSDHSNVDKTIALRDMLFWMDRKRYPAVASISANEHWVAVAGFSIAGSDPPPGSGTATLEWICFHDPIASDPSTCMVTGSTWLTDSAYWGDPHSRPGSMWDNKYITIVEPPPLDDVQIVVPKPPREGLILAPQAVQQKFKAWLRQMKKMKGCGARILNLSQLQDIKTQKPLRVTAWQSGRQYDYYLLAAESPSRLVAVVNAYDGSVEEIRHFERKQRYVVDANRIKGIIKKTLKRYNARILKLSSPRLTYRPEFTQVGRSGPIWEIQSVVKDAKGVEKNLPIALSVSGSIIQGIEDLAVSQGKVKKKIFFSTEEDFILQGPTPPGGNPVISDGDLLHSGGTVYMRNRELLTVFQVPFDLGLDAADVIEIEDRLVAFSTELDHPKGLFGAGDLLTTKGAVLPNAAILAAFDIPRELDLGLDAVHFIGKHKAIIKFLEVVRERGREFWQKNPGRLIDHLKEFNVDIWFSTEGTAPHRERPIFLDGDLLSAATGAIVAANHDLLPPVVPAGIPNRGVDFGLDAVSSDRRGNKELVHFSTEILYTGEPDFTDGDVLRFGNAITVSNPDLIRPFKPKAKFLGLDSLSFAARYCPVNPPKNTAISAHGNTDWHVDTAEEFLFGTDMGGSPTAANHCPDSWSRRHMHVGLTDANHFYYDRDLASPGDDADTTNGIDQAMLFFYAGHGSPESFDTLDNSAQMEFMHLGDCPGNGLLRYYWQCSCKVFAHGPMSCPGGGLSYSCPGLFDGSPDSASMRNVYERWGPVLDPDLRLACGSSTLAWCHESNVNRIWDRYNNLSLDVTDSFIFGLGTSTSAIPLCMTMGGANVAATPLYDTAFTNQPNTSGTSHYHIQWLASFAATTRSSRLELSVPKSLPTFTLKPMSQPKPLRQVKFKVKDEFMVSPDEQDGRGPRVRINRLSGATYVLGSRKMDPEGKILKPDEFIHHAQEYLEKQSWGERHISEPIGARAMITSQTLDGKNRQQYLKNAVVTFKRQIVADDLKINVLGDGGTITVQMNNDGSVLNASKVWRQISEVKTRVALKTFEQAYQEALKQIKEQDKYKLDYWTWGYKEAAGNVKQTVLSIVFLFDFVPVETDLERYYPPRQIEIPAPIS
jgi:hypothetical protein